MFKIIKKNFNEIKKNVFLNTIKEIKNNNIKFSNLTSYQNLLYGIDNYKVKINQDFFYNLENNFLKFNISSQYYKRFFDIMNYNDLNLKNPIYFENQLFKLSKEIEVEEILILIKSFNKKNYDKIFLMKYFNYLLENCKIEKKLIINLFYLDLNDKYFINNLKTDLLEIIEDINEIDFKLLIDKLNQNKIFINNNIEEFENINNSLYEKFKNFNHFGKILFLDNFFNIQNKEIYNNLFKNIDNNILTVFEIINLNKINIKLNLGFELKSFIPNKIEFQDFINLLFYYRIEFLDLIKNININYNFEILKINFQKILILINENVYNFESEIKITIEKQFYSHCFNELLLIIYKLDNKEIIKKLENNLLEIDEIKIHTYEDFISIITTIDLLNTKKLLNIKNKLIEKYNNK